MLTRLVIPTLLAGALALGGCNHVPLEEDAATVLVISSDDAGQCKHLGKTVVEVLDKVLFFTRGQDTMAGELTTLARNAALDMGGNAVAPESDVEDGKQTFGIYSCPAE